MNYLDIFGLLHTFANLLYALGFFSELIVLIFVIFFIYENSTDLAFYLVGIVLNGFLNRVLKPIFQDPRPTKPIKFLDSEEFPKKIDYTKNSNYYGMPSGHSQNVAYSLAYLYWTIPETFMIRIWAILFGIMTVFERWWFRNHTLMQLAVGVLVGTGFAYLTTYIRNEWKKTKLQPLPK
mgnify:CR=1 FL=1